MPNNFGGSQCHPAYTGADLRKDPRRICVGNVEYRIVGDGRDMHVVCEDVDGSAWGMTVENAPAALQKKAQKLIAAWQKKLAVRNARRRESRKGKSRKS